MTFFAFIRINKKGLPSHHKIKLRQQRAIFPAPPRARLMFGVVVHQIKIAPRPMNPIQQKICVERIIIVIVLHKNFGKQARCE